jgi:SAM-dependent methyltransferase
MTRRRAFCARGAMAGVAMRPRRRIHVSNETETSTAERYRAFLRKRHSPAHARRTAERNAAFLLPHLRPGMRLIDAGCGPGSITIGLAAAVAGKGGEAVAPGEAVGVDASVEALDGARALAAERGCANVRFETGDVYALPFADGSFDAGFMHAVVQHLDDPAAAVREMRRVLRPGAVMGIGDMDFDGYLLHPMTPALVRAGAMMKELRLRSGGTIDAGRRLRGLLHDAGFERVEVSVAANCDGTAEAVARAAWWQASYLEAPEFAAQVVELGLTTQAELGEMAAAWRAWGADPAALQVMLGFQAVGWVA